MHLGRTLVLLALVAAIPPTSAGIERIAIEPGPAASRPYLFTPFAGEVYFIAEQQATGAELWRTDGTAEGTAMVKDIAPGPESGLPEFLGGIQPSRPVVFGDTLIFVADDGVTGRELWKTDGTADGTVMIADIAPGPDSGGPTHFFVLGGEVLFIARTPTTGWELWKTDGTTDGTVLVREIVPGPDSSLVRPIHVLDDRLLFIARSGPDSAPFPLQLWATDGTYDGTVLVKEDVAFASSDHTARFGDSIVFTGATGENDWELWVSDGTTDGTVRLTAFGVDGPYGLQPPRELTEFAGRLFFSAETDETSLWSTDGTPDGTRRFEVDGVWFDSPAGLTVANDTLFFASWVDDLYGLWKTDGTADGTTLLTPDSWVAAGDGPRLVRFGDRVVFQGRREIGDGQQLWISDGTVEGTSLLRAFDRGLPLSPITVLGDRVFFTPEDEHLGRELWVSDGTPVGTVLVEELLPGSGTAYPFIVAATPVGLLFRAHDVVEPPGSELYVLPAPSPPASPVDRRGLRKPARDAPRRHLGR